MSSKAVRVYTSKSGRRYAHTREVLNSPTARAEISRNVQLSKERKVKSESASAASGTRKK